MPPPRKRQRTTQAPGPPDAGAAGAGAGAGAVRCFLELGLDYGTSATKVAAVIRREDGKEGTTPTVVRIQGAPSVPSCFAYHNGIFYYGRDLEDRVDRRREPYVPADAVIENAKLGLYEQHWHDDGPAIREVKRKLKKAGKTLDDALADFMKHIVEATLQQIVQGEYGANFTLDELRNMTKHVRLPMPQMWSPTARRRMIVAVKAAGIDLVEPASEPQCALAHYLDRTAKKNIPIALEANDTIIVADLGCGTGDIVLYRIVDALDINSDVNAVDHASGAMCGSHVVNSNIKQQLDGPPGTLDAKARQCQKQIPTDVFHWRLTRSIEAAKTDTETVGRHAMISVVDDNGDVVFMKSVNLQDMDRAHTKSAHNIIAAVDALAEDHQPKLIVLAGGFRKSQPLQKILRDTYEQKGRTAVVLSDDPYDTMIAEGSLSKRYDKIKASGLPFKYSYAILQDEDADPILHPDCYRKYRGQPMPIDRKVKPTGYLDEHGKDIMVVIDRLIIVLDKDCVNQGEKKHESPGIIFHPLVTNPRISSDFVYCDPTIGTFENHGPALVSTHNAASEENEFRPGIKRWVTAAADLNGHKALLDASGCDIEQNYDGEVCYRIPANITVDFKSEATITIGWDLQVGDRRFHVESEVWNTRYSEFSEEHDHMKEKPDKTKSARILEYEEKDDLGDLDYQP